MPQISKDNQRQIYGHRLTNAGSMTNALLNSHPSYSTHLGCLFVCFFVFKRKAIQSQIRGQQAVKIQVNIFKMQIIPALNKTQKSEVNKMIQVF